MYALKFKSKRFYSNKQLKSFDKYPRLGIELYYALIILKLYFFTKAALKAMKNDLEANPSLQSQYGSIGDYYNKFDRKNSQKEYYFIIYM